MKTFCFLLLSLTAYSPRAHAYLPPSFYVYGRVAELKAKSTNPALQISVSRPASAGTEEALGSLTLASWQHEVNGWPSLDLLFEDEKDRLIRAAEAFGIPVIKESDLVRVSRDQIRSAKELPHPFYKPDRRMGLKRYKQTYAWVNKEGAREIWIEKDTFVPLKIVGPCPDGVKDLPWAKDGGGTCELEFRNIGALRRGNGQGARLLLWKDGTPLLFFSFDKVSSAKAAAAGASNLNAALQSIADTVLR